MAVEILEIKKEHCPGALLIGKRYENVPDWNEWWANGWFDVLENQPRLPFGDDAYIGAVRVVNGRPERWIGMIFPEDVKTPAGFESVRISPLDFAVCYLYGKEGNGEFYAIQTHERCLQALKEHQFIRDEDNWCFERYQCPRFTTPDEHGCVILDYAISIL